jgi:intracellular multiplication protein IcmV
MGNKRRAVRGFIGNLFNVKRWFGYGHIQASAQFLKAGFRSVLEQRAVLAKIPPLDPDQRTFGVAPEVLYAMKKGYLLNTYIFLIWGLLLAGYSTYHFLNGNLYAGCMTFLLMVPFFCMTAYTHYWYFQAKHDRRGCSLREWYTGKITALDYHES